MSCDCNTLVVGEAGPQGAQGLAGINGTNGTNGVNAYSTTTASFTQPASTLSPNNSTSFLVNTNLWIAIGQIVFVQDAGYYKVSGLAGTTGVSVTLLALESPSTFNQAVSSGKKVTPSGNVLAATNLNSLSVSGTSSLDGAVTINASSANVDTNIKGDSDSSLVYVDASADSVGIGTNTPSSKFHVNGTIRSDGNCDVRGSLVVNENASSTSNFRVEGQASANLIYTDPTANRVGINTNTPTTLFNVNGNTETNSLVVNQTSGSTGVVMTVYGQGATTRLTVTDNGAGTVGAVGVGTASPSLLGASSGQTNLSVNGVINSPKLAVTSGSVNSAITGVFYGAYTFPVSPVYTILASVNQFVDVTVTGASIGDFVMIGTPTPSASGFHVDVGVYGKVIAADSVRVVFRNYSANPYSFAASAVLKVLVISAQAIP